MEKIIKAKRAIRDGKELVIRIAELSDAKNLLSLGKSIMAEKKYTLTQVDEFNLSIEQEKEWVRSYYEDQNHLILVAEIDSEIVGQIAFSNGRKKLTAHTGEFGMGVHKDFRGLGIGSALIEELIKWAQVNPIIEKINLAVHHTNKRAIAMYKRHGFKIEGTRINDLKYSQDEYVDTVLMGLLLVKIVCPSMRYAVSFLNAIKEFGIIDEAENNGYKTNSEITNLDAVRKYIEVREQERKGINLKEGYVPATMFWIIVGGKYCGEISLRHSLTPALEKFGGHIGYGIRPSERKNGHGTAALRLVLLKAVELGLKKVLITCYKSNIASAKIILSNGGVLFDEIQNDGHHDLTQRYWITL